MRHAFRITLALIMLAAATLVGGCTSSADYDPTVRRERLLALYPPGQTSRADVQARWRPIEPEFSALRPENGWEALGRPRVCEHVAASEARTGKRVQSLECYVGPDGLFGLCYCWFYYDEGDQVLDAEWQYHTD